MAKSIAASMETKVPVHEGVYAMLGGPNFETVAELKMLRICGVDAVGKPSDIIILSQGQANEISR